MAEQENKRSYKVLVPIRNDNGNRARDDHNNLLFADLGVLPASTAEAAVAAYLDRLAPEATVGIKDAIAVPVGNWNECEVEEDPRPRFKVRRRSEPQTQPTSPDPDDAT